MSNQRKNSKFFLISLYIFIGLFYNLLPKNLLEYSFFHLIYCIFCIFIYYSFFLFFYKRFCSSRYSVCSCNSRLCKFLYHMKLRMYNIIAPDTNDAIEWNVRLNIYNLNSSNSFLYPIGLGFYHSGVEVLRFIILYLYLK